MIYDIDDDTFASFLESLNRLHLCDHINDLFRGMDNIHREYFPGYSLLLWFPEKERIYGGEEDEYLAPLRLRLAYPRVKERENVFILSDEPVVGEVLEIGIPIWCEIIVAPDSDMYKALTFLCKRYSLDDLVICGVLPVDLGQGAFGVMLVISSKGCSLPLFVQKRMELYAENISCGLRKLLIIEQLKSDSFLLSLKLSAVNRIGELLSALDLEILLMKLMEFAVETVEAEVGSIMLLEKDKLVTKVEWGLKGEHILSLQDKRGMCVVEKVLNSKKPLYVFDIAKSDICTKSLIANITSFICIPLFTTRKLLGVMNLVNTSSNRNFTDSDFEMLHTVSGLASIAVENAVFYKEAVEKKRIEEQLSIARRIQDELLPREFPEWDMLNFCGRSKAARHVGGDYFDFIDTREPNKKAVVIADVAGKGIPAAILMSMVRALIKAEAWKITSPSEILSKVNMALCRESILSAFVTVLYCVVDIVKGHIIYSNAGHNPLYVFDESGKGLSVYPSTSTPLGIFENASYKDHMASFDHGSLLVMHTDGVTDAVNRKGESFGAERFKQLLIRYAAEKPENLVRIVFDELTAFSKGVEQRDDITLVIGKFQ